jgi:hypothetical protein
MHFTFSRKKHVAFPSKISEYSFHGTFASYVRQQLIIKINAEVDTISVIEATPLEILRYSISLYYCIEKLLFLTVIITLGPQGIVIASYRHRYGLSGIIFAFRSYRSVHHGQALPLSQIKNLFLQYHTPLLFLSFFYSSLYFTCPTIMSLFIQ